MVNTTKNRKQFFKPDVAIIIFGIFQFLALIVATPFAFAYFMYFSHSTSQIVAVVFLSVWIFGVVMGYATWFHAWSIVRVLERKNKNEL